MTDLIIGMIVLGIMAITAVFVIQYSNKTRRRMMDEMDENEADLDLQTEDRAAKLEKVHKPEPQSVEVEEPKKEALVADIVDVLGKAAEIAQTATVQQPPKKKRRGRPKSKKNS